MPEPISYSFSPREDRRAKEGIERLYEIYEHLNSAEGDKKAGESYFRELLVRVASCEREKRLASQFISRFVEYYPWFEEEAIDALYDICEDDDGSLRKQAQRDLVAVCRKLPHLVTSVSYAFVQVLQTDDLTDRAAIQDCLKSLFIINAELALVGLFARIREGGYGVIGQCLKFLQAQLKSLGAEAKASNVEARLFKEIGLSMTFFDNMEHFKTVMEILHSTSYIRKPEGTRRVVEMVETLLGVQKASATVTDESIAKLLICTDFLFPFFHAASSASLFAHYCLNILPNIPGIDEVAQFSLVRMAVDLSLYFDKLDKVQGKLCLEGLLKTADSFLAKPSPNPKDRAMPNYQFSVLECILYLVHRLGSMLPDAFKELTEKESFQDLKIKLRLMLRAVVPYRNKLQADLRPLDRDGLSKEDVKVICLRALTNISIMIKGLWQEKVCEEEIKGMRISWKARTFSRCCKETIAVHNRKIGKGGDATTRLYQPPTGKYSGRTGSFDFGSVRRITVQDDESSTLGGRRGNVMKARSTQYYSQRQRGFRY